MKPVRPAFTGRLGTGEKTGVRMFTHSQYWFHTCAHNCAECERNAPGSLHLSLQTCALLVPTLLQTRKEDLCGRHRAPVPPGFCLGLDSRGSWHEPGGRSKGGVSRFLLWLPLWSLYSSMTGDRCCSLGGWLAIALPFMAPPMIPPFLPLGLGW